LWHAIVTNGDFTAYVCNIAMTWPSSQITLGKLVYLPTSDACVFSYWHHSSRTATTSSTTRLSIRNVAPTSGCERWHRSRQMPRTWANKLSLTRNTGWWLLHTIISHLTVAAVQSASSPVSHVSPTTDSGIIRKIMCSTFDDYACSLCK